MDLVDGPIGLNPHNVFASCFAVHEDGVVCLGDGTKPVDRFKTFERLTAGLDPVIALSTSRAELIAASPVSFDALGGRWSGGEPVDV